MLDKIESGEILISEQNGSDVHYKMSWTTKAMADNLSKAVAEGEEVLRKISDGGVNDVLITDAKNAVNNAISRFNLYEGNFKPIERLKF